MSSTDRATCWSITINNPTEEEVRCDMPGWKLTGQYEAGENGTRHFQGMLETPQVRFSAVKRVFTRAHIEVCRNKTALAKYVSKEETRVGEYTGSAVPSLFQYQDTIAQLWDEREFNRRLGDDFLQRKFKCDSGDIALDYVDTLVAAEIRKGQRGIEFIAINPMWRSSWKKFYASIIERNEDSRSRQGTGLLGGSRQEGTICREKVGCEEGCGESPAVGICAEGDVGCESEGGNEVCG